MVYNKKMGHQFRKTVVNEWIVDDDKVTSLLLIFLRYIRHVKMEEWKIKFKYSLLNS